MIINKVVAVGIKPGGDGLVNLVTVVVVDMKAAIFIIIRSSSITIIMLGHLHL